MNDITENAGLGNLVSYLRDTLDERHRNKWEEGELRDSVDEVIGHTFQDNEEEVIDVRNSGVFNNDNDGELKKYLEDQARKWFEENDMPEYLATEPEEDGGSMSPGR